jgi:probable F420-dependent oxidoreductase
LSRRPFRFAVQGVHAASARDWVDLARKVESLGYATLFLADHYLGPGPAGAATLLEPQQLAPIAAMTAAAAATQTLRVGCRVFCVDYHEPAVLAKEAATIDFLSDGRLEFGIGAGWHAAEYEAMGLTFGKAPDRVDKLEEVIALVKAHWSGDEIAMQGEYVRVSGYSGLPLPVQKPRPPIMIGGSRRRVLSLAGREADIVSLANVPWTPINEVGLTPTQEAARRVDFALQAAGERSKDLDIESSPWFSEITNRSDEAYEKMAATMRNADPEVLRDHPNVLVGTVDHVVDVLNHRRDILGVNYITIQQPQMESFAPVCARLTGT